MASRLEAGLKKARCSGVHDRKQLLRRLALSLNLEIMQGS
jgi:hypothetical protein